MYSAASPALPTVSAHGPGTGWAVDAGFVEKLAANAVVRGQTTLAPVQLCDDEDADGWGAGGACSLEQLGDGGADARRKARRKEKKRLAALAAQAEAEEPPMVTQVHQKVPHAPPASAPGEKLSQRQKKRMKKEAEEGAR